MARNLGLDEVVDDFTLVGDELDQLHNETGRFASASRWPRNSCSGRAGSRGTPRAPDDAVEPARWAYRRRSPYDIAGRTAQRHRSEIRRDTGFRECSVVEADKLAWWLAPHVAESERRGTGSAGTCSFAAIES